MLRGGPFGLLSALMRTINQFSSDADLTEKSNHLYQPTFRKEMYLHTPASHKLLPPFLLDNKNTRPNQKSHHGCPLWHREI
jgi:hypothetical protein